MVESFAPHKVGGHPFEGAANFVDLLRFIQI